MPTYIRILFAVLGVAMIGFGIMYGYKTYERDQRTAHIRSERESLQVRIDALKTEMQTKTTDPAEIKSRQERLNALEKDLDALTKEVGAPAP